MNRINVRTLAQAGAFAAAVLLAGSAVAVTKDEYRATKDRIGADYKAAKAKCDAPRATEEPVRSRSKSGRKTRQGTRRSRLREHAESA